MIREPWEVFGDNYVEFPDSGLGFPAAIVTTVAKDGRGWQREVCAVYGGADDAENGQLAALIAEAPAMLRVLNDLRTWAAYMGGFDSAVWQDLDAVVKRATGGPAEAGEAEANNRDMEG